jgi:hypothetical protein
MQNAKSENAKREMQSAKMQTRTQANACSEMQRFRPVVL